MSEEKRKPGCLWPAAWLVLCLLGTVVAGVAVGMSGYNSESAGVLAAKAVAFPIGLLWTGALVALVVHLAKAGKGIRIGAPLGCGCLGGVFFLVALLLFFGGIWQSL